MSRSTRSGVVSTRSTAPMSPPAFPMTDVTRPSMPGLFLISRRTVKLYDALGVIAIVARVALEILFRHCDIPARRVTGRDIRLGTFPPMPVYDSRRSAVSLRERAGIEYHFAANRLLSRGPRNIRSGFGVI